MVTQQNLDLLFQVRILAGQFIPPRGDSCCLEGRNAGQLIRGALCYEGATDNYFGGRKRDKDEV